MDQNRIKKTDVGAEIILDKNKDYYFFPLYPSLGFSNRGNKTLISEKVYNSIINGENPIILKWEGSEDALSWEDPDNYKNASEQATFTNKNLKRNIRIGKYMVGMITKANYFTDFTSKQSGFTNITKDLITYQEQTINKKIHILINDKWSKDQGLFHILDPDSPSVYDGNTMRYFFLCPELAGNDVLYIEEYTLHLNSDGSYAGSTITFASLGERISNIGQQINTLVSFAGPGEAVVLPKVSTNWEEQDDKKEWKVLINPDEDRVISEGDNQNVFEPSETETARPILNTKIPWIDEEKFTDQTNEVAYIGLDFNGLAAINSVKIYGAKKIVRGGAFDPRLIGSPQLLFCHEVSEPIEPNYLGLKYMLRFKNIVGEIKNVAWFTNNQSSPDQEREVFQDFMDPGTERKVLGMLESPYSVDDIVKNHDYFDIQQKGQKGGTGGDVKIGGVRKLSFSNYSDYKLRPKQKSDKSVVFTDDDGKTGIGQFTSDIVSFAKNNAITMSDILFQNALAEENIDLLYAGGEINYSLKATLRKAFDLGFTGVPLVGGLFSSIFKSLATNWLPEPIWLQQRQYWKGSYTNFLVPQYFLNSVSLKTGLKQFAGIVSNINANRIPLMFFANEDSNYLKSYLNSVLYPVQFSARLTDQVVIQNTTINTDELGYGYKKGTRDKPAGKSKFFGTTFPPYQDGSFAIYGIEIRCLTQKPIRISFYNKNKKLVWEQIVKSQNQKTGNMNDWTTRQSYINYQMQGLDSDERYIGPARTDRVGEPILNFADYVGTFGIPLTAGTANLEANLVYKHQPSLKQGIKTTIDRAIRRTFIEKAPYSNDNKIEVAKPVIQTTPGRRSTIIGINPQITWPGYYIEGYQYNIIKLLTTKIKINNLAGARAEFNKGLLVANALSTDKETLQYALGTKVIPNFKQRTYRTVAFDFSFQYFIADEILEGAIRGNTVRNAVFTVNKNYYHKHTIQNPNNSQFSIKIRLNPTNDPTKFEGEIPLTNVWGNQKLNWDSDHLWLRQWGNTWKRQFYDQQNDRMVDITNPTHSKIKVSLDVNTQEITFSVVDYVDILEWKTGYFRIGVRQPNGTIKVMNGGSRPELDWFKFANIQILEE